MLLLREVPHLVRRVLASLRRRLAVPVQRLRLVLRHTQAALLIDLAEGELRAEEAGVARLRVPLEGQRRVLLHPATAVVARGELVHRLAIAAVRRGLVPAHCVLLAALDAPAPLVELGQVSLGRRTAGERFPHARLERGGPLLALHARRAGRTRGR